jgi:hypothetical protein
VSDELTPGGTHGDDGRAGEDDGPGTGFDRSGFDRSEFDRPELAVALYELAQDHETPVPVPGAEIRRRAGRRRRRRRQASLAAAGATVAGALVLVLTVVLTGGEDAGSTPPAATYAASTPPVTREPGAVPVAATVDLARRELTAEGRTLPISSGAFKTPTPTGLMTVTAKYQAATVPGESLGFNGPGVKASWVMRLRAPNDRTNYLVALTWDEKAPGNYDSTGGVIGLRRVDAMWLYKALKPGSVVEVVGAAPRETPTGAVPEAPTDTVLPGESAGAVVPEGAERAVPEASAVSGGRDGSDGS